MKNKIKHLLARLLFGKPIVMSLYKDKNGNLFGGTIQKNDSKSYIDNVSHIKNPNYLGQVKIYL
jgi:hypothetical protein